MADDEAAAHAKLLVEYRALEEAYADHDDPEEVDVHLGELEQAMDKIETRPLVFDQEEVVRAGAFVTLDRYGDLAVYRGYVRPEDESRAESTVHDGVDPVLEGQGSEIGRSEADRKDGISQAIVITFGGQSVGTGMSDEDNDGVMKPLPERMLTELTAHRTLALREAVGRSPVVALTLLIRKLVTDTFRTSGTSGSCLEASVRHVHSESTLLTPT